MVEGTYTLPVLRALAIPGVGDDLRALLGGPLDAPTRDKARDLVLSTPAVLSLPAGDARRWAERADRALDPMRRRRRMGAGWPRLGVLGPVGHRLIDELDEFPEPHRTEVGGPSRSAAARSAGRVQVPQRGCMNVRRELRPGAVRPVPGAGWGRR